MLIQIFIRFKFKGLSIQKNGGVSGEDKFNLWALKNVCHFFFL